MCLLARRGGARTGHGRARELVKWANDAVEAGWSASAVVRLAGETAPFYSSEIDEAFIHLLDELELPEPPSFESLLIAELIIVSQSIVTGRLAAQDGLELVAQIVIDSAHA
ncbi:MAG: hypothetical protein AAF658_07250, partial [Myxococcota bacterium]